MSEQRKKIGVVTHFFGHIEVAVIKLVAAVSKGDKILIKGNTTNFEQEIKSMQKDHKEILKANKGDEIGLKVKNRVREQDMVYKV